MIRTGIKLKLIITLLSVCLYAEAQRPDPIVAGNARFTVITPSLVRMEYATDGNFVDEPTLFAYNRDSLYSGFKLLQNGDTITITTTCFKLRYINDGLPFSQMNIRATIFDTPNNHEWRIYSTDDENLGGALTTLDGLDSAVATDDGLLSKNGWHIIDDSRKEILKDGWIAERPVAHLADYYFFAYGHDYKAALRSLTTISGKVPMTRKYVHGSWYCRWWNYSDSDYYKIVQEYKDHDFPLDVLVLDMGWHTQKEATTGMGHAGMYGWTGYTWNRKLFSDPEKFLLNLKQDGIHVTLNDHPHDGIRHHEETYPAFMKSMGVDTANNRELLFDAGSKKYMDNFFEYALAPNERKGVDFWWLDWQQDYLLPYVQGFRNLKHMPWLNYLYFNHSKKDDQRGLIFSRWAGWGSQRTPIQFSGDAEATWNMLKFEVSFTATSGNAGCFFWAHDVGGFSGKRNVEQYVRWTQFALTSSSLRIHSDNDSKLDRRPWLWGAQAENAMRKIYHLRSQLMPYIYSSVWQCHSLSVPLNRAMYIDYPYVETAYQNPQQFMFGDLLLSAPIVAPGEGPDFTAAQNVWFPQGDTWYNIFNGDKYEGGQKKSITANINSFPLFAKGGYPIPMQPYKQRMTAGSLDRLVIRCYPGAIGKQNSYSLYEDDGISNDYLVDRGAVTGLHYQQLDHSAIITIDAVSGTYKGQPTARAFQIELPLSGFKKITINNKKVKFKLTAKPGGTVIDIPAVSITNQLTIICR